MEGCTERSFVRRLAVDAHPVALPLPVCSDVVSVPSGATWACVTETSQAFASVAIVRGYDTQAAVTSLSLPHPTTFDDLRVRRLEWVAKDGTRVTGVLCNSAGQSCSAS